MLTDILLGGALGWLLSAKGPKATAKVKDFLAHAAENGKEIRQEKKEETQNTESRPVE